MAIGHLKLTCATRILIKLRLSINFNQLYNACFVKMKLNHKCWFRKDFKLSRVKYSYETGQFAICQIE